MKTENENVRQEKRTQVRKEWEAPKLISLDKGKTEGGTSAANIEDTSLASGTPS